MNRTQREAWLNLICNLFSILVFSIVAYLLLTGFLFDKHWLIKSTAVFAVGLVVLYFFFVYFLRKRYPREDADERDEQVALKATRICLISVCLLIYLSDAIILFVTGLDGSILSSVLPFMHFIMGYFGVVLYYAAVIVLYAKGNKTIKGEVA